MNIQSPLIPSMQRSNRQLGNMYTGYEKRLLQKPKTKHNKTINPKKQKHNKKNDNTLFSAMFAISI